MKNRMIAFVLGTAALAIPALALNAEAGMAYAQTPSASPLLLPPLVEHELAAKATNATEVTLNKDMLGFASKFMNGKDKDQAAVSQLIQGLDGIYVRDYEFDKEGEYSMDDIEKLRQAIETPEWTPIVRDRERKGAEINDVMVKMVNGETQRHVHSLRRAEGDFDRADSGEYSHGSAGHAEGNRRTERSGRRGEEQNLGDVKNKAKDKTKTKDKGGDQ